MAETKKDEEQVAQVVNWWEMDTVKMCEEGAYLQPEMPNGDLAPFKIKLIGKDSKAYGAKIRRVYEKTRNKKKGLNAAEIEIERMAIAVACTIEWDVKWTDGKELPCTSDNVEMIYTQFPWILEQVEDFIGDRANFLS